MFASVCGPLRAFFFRWRHKNIILFQQQLHLAGWIAITQKVFPGPNFLYLNVNTISHKCQIFKYSQICYIFRLWMKGSKVFDFYLTNDVKVKSTWNRQSLKDWLGPKRHRTRRVSLKKEKDPIEVFFCLFLWGFQCWWNCNIQAMKVSLVWRMRWLRPSSPSSSSTSKTLFCLCSDLADERFSGILGKSSVLLYNSPGLTSTSSFSFNGQAGGLHPPRPPSELTSSGILCKVFRPPIVSPLPTIVSPLPRLYPDSPKWLSTVAKLYLGGRELVKWKARLPTLQVPSWTLMWKSLTRSSSPWEGWSCCWSSPAAKFGQV